MAAIHSLNAAKSNHGATIRAPRLLGADAPAFSLQETPSVGASLLVLLGRAIALGRISIIFYTLLLSLVLCGLRTRIFEGS